jgi:YVTN family beta-propeller protein
MFTTRHHSRLIGFVLIAACSGESSSDESAALQAPTRASGSTAGPTSTAGAAATARATVTPGATAGANPATMASGGAATPTGAAGARAPDIVDTLAPEQETSVDFQLPQASEHYVYATNPSAGTVAIIDATTQAIQTIKTGAEPTYLRTLEGTDNAVVLNVGSNKASIIRMRDDKAQKTDLPVNAGANAIAVAPNGKHVVVYYNANYKSAGKSPGSYQDIAVLQIADNPDDDRAVSMTVGFQPRDVFFDDQSARAYVVTDDGVSVLDFEQIEREGAGIAKLVTFGGAVDQKNLDVAITPDGEFALARTNDQSVLHLVELATGQVRTLDLSLMFPADTGEDAGVAARSVIVTDLDLMPTGREALAALRNQSAVVRLALPQAFEDPAQVKTIFVDGEVVGSLTVAPNGKTALAYTTAAPELERVVIVDLENNGAPRTALLRKSVGAVAYTPDSSTALITHEKQLGSPDEPGLSPEAQVDRSYGYSLLRLSTGDVKLQRTATQLGPIAMVPDASYLFILFRDDALQLKEVQRVALKSFLVDPIIALENPPISMGVARASGAVFVNLDHPDGRMTFIDWEEPVEKLKTVTGFELNSRIRN